MKKIMKIIESYAVKLVLSKKEQIIKTINSKIDLPLLNEKDEQELLEGLWEVIETGVKEVLKPKKD